MYDDDPRFRARADAWWQADEPSDDDSQDDLDPYSDDEYEQIDRMTR
jgi:hypothetical protein